MAAGVRRHCFRIFGYDVSVKPSIDLALQRCHPDDVKLVGEMVERAAGDQPEFDYQHRLLLPDGAVKTIQVTARALNGEPGKLQFVGAVMDVTARTKAYEALQRTEQRYRHLSTICQWRSSSSARTAG